MIVIVTAQAEQKDHNSRDNKVKRRGLYRLLNPDPKKPLDKEVGRKMVDPVRR